MKHFNVIASAGVVCTAFVAVNLAFIALAWNEWKQAYCDSGTGLCWYTKVMSRRHPYVIYEINSPLQTSKKEADCQQFKSRYLGEPYKGGRSEWIVSLPGSIGESVLNTVC